MRGNDACWFANCITAAIGAGGVPCLVAILASVQTRALKVILPQQATTGGLHSAQEPLNASQLYVCGPS